MADKQGSALLIETWAQAARNTSGHQRDYVIEVLKKRGDLERSASEQRKSDKKKSDNAGR
jgi:hypothetical protein